MVTTAAPGSAAQAALRLLTQTLQPAADMSAPAWPAATGTPAQVLPSVHP
ncbi:hypothetical protein ACFQ2Y_26055 [Streptomyces malaysiensis subsp. malaysiensis]